MVFREKNEYFETILSKYQCGFRKEFIAQHFLLTMLEQWKSAIDEKKKHLVHFIDPSKAFDGLSHDLLKAKLSTYGFSLPALRSIQSYLSKGKKRTKITQSSTHGRKLCLG